MGLTDWIPGLGSTEAGSADDVDTYYLADETPWNTELREYRLLIGPATETDDEWTVYRCTDDDTEIPPQTELLVFQEGRVVPNDGSPFRLHLAQLVLGDRVDKEGLDGYFVEFPAELAGEPYSERGPVDDDELRRFLRSVPGDF
ncbi:hypothetical protein [Halohasta salina]|uniref:hypothetical protein n=1 Tax=Halohasta salina TaxID=2961621 RepID=UPI0020A553A2|nr:hypothetical protein [Halohasta salina]